MSCGLTWMRVIILRAAVHNKELAMSQSKTDHNEQDAHRWQLTLEDAGDGSGDAILLLPDDLLEHLNWHEGDVLDLSATDDGAIRVVKKS